MSQPSYAALHAERDAVAARIRASAWLRRRRQLLTVEDAKVLMALRALRCETPATKKAER